MKIYALLDFELLQKYSLSFEKYINICKNKGAEIIQYRDKINSLEQKRENLQKIRELWSKTLIINDNIELVEFCDGVHLGQEDLQKIDKNSNNAISKIRDKIKDKIIGISTHNQKEIEITNRLNIDYIGLGAYRATSTKDNVSLLGESIEEIAKYSKHKVAVIGGVRIDDKIENVEYFVIGRGLIED